MDRFDVGDPSLIQPGPYPRRNTCLMEGAGPCCRRFLAAEHVYRYAAADIACPTRQYVVAFTQPKD
jgi:hypothetical protein